MLLGGVQQIWGVDWAAWLLAIATAVVALGIVFAIIGVSETRKNRHGEIAVEFARRWSEPHLVESRKLAKGLTAKQIKKKYFRLKDSDHPDYYVMQRLPAFFEDIATLEEYDFLDLEWIDSLFRTVAIQRWEAWEKTVKRLQETDPDAYIYWERLIKKLHHPPKRRWRFWRWRIRMT